MKHKKPTGLFNALGMMVVSAGLLADWGGMATSLNEMWPVTVAVLRPIAVAGLTIGSLTAGWIGWRRIQATLPTARFKGMEWRITSARDAIQKASAAESAHYFPYDDVITLRSDLEEDLEIPCPPANPQETELWLIFLSELALRARRSDLKSARTLLRKVQKQLSEANYPPPQSPPPNAS